MTPVRTVRNFLRQSVDRLQYSKVRHAQLLGHHEAAWCLDTNLVRTSENPVMFSGGAGKDITFEKAFVNTFSGTVFLYDPSPTGKQTVDSEEPVKGLSFIAKALDKQGGLVKMDKPQSMMEGSWTINGVNSNQKTDEFESVSLVQEIMSKGYQKVDVIKLDIEGFEYGVIEDILDSNLQVNQLLVEFHDFFPTISRMRTWKIRLLLKAKGYKCFYKHRYDYSFRIQ